jgi:3-oxoacyl-[acyl-carrier protein] reductase
MDLGIKGRVALVQGASAGLGRAIAQALVEEGCRVAICSRDAAKVERAREAIGAELAVACDLAQPGAALALAREVEAKLGPCDILVHNTGGPPKVPFADVTTAQWHDGFAGLWMSAVDSIQGALPSMRARGWGRILLVTSVAAREPLPGLTISNGFRAGLLGLAKSLSNEVAGQGITVNCLLPGYTDTERLRDLKVSYDAIGATVPAGRVGKPEEFAALAAFLASERAAYISGQAVACDGGWLRGA